MTFDPATTSSSSGYAETFKGLLRRCLAGALILTLASCSSPASERPEYDAVVADLQAVLDEAITSGQPGVSAAIATKNGILWAGTAGFSNIQTGAPVEPDMLFGIGSITKTFVNVVILQLAEEGRLDLTDTAANILGDAVDGIPNADTATIDQLLKHTSGVPSWEDDPLWIHEGRGNTLNPSEIWGKTQTLPYIKGHDPLFEAGERFSYANTNYTLLGMIIEKITGEDAVTEIHTRILDPLGLSNIYLEGFEDVPEEQLPHRYHWATTEFQESAGVNAAFSVVRDSLIDATGSNLSVEWTAGGMVASATDLAVYGEALKNGKLLSPESMAFMTDWFPIGTEGRRFVGHNVFKTTYQDGTVTIGHNGDVLGFNSTLYWIEGTEVVIAVVGNVGTMHSGAVPIRASSIGNNPEFREAALKLASF
ncbi:beta-lactamase family protein [bacterium]|nr:beta-lactamase family protein [bacterium]